MERTVRNVGAQERDSCVLGRRRRKLPPKNGAVALGHPLGMSGARLLQTATEELHRRNGRYALCAMCIGVGQGIASIIERV